MITDDRLDQLVRASLEWQAGQAVVAQPSLDAATRRLAGRVGSPTTGRAPRFATAPATTSPWRLVAIVLLLAAMLVTAAVVGSILLREPPPPIPGPFGFTSDCGEPFQYGVTGSFFIGEQERSLYPSGSVVSGPILQENADESPLTRTQGVEGTAFLERRLSPRGVELLQDRVLQLGLTPGCRAVRTREGSGSFVFPGPDGLAGVTWNSTVSSGAAPRWGLQRLATPQEEADLSDLARDLEHLDDWLPEAAWIDATERRVAPDRWLVFMTLADPVGSDRGYDDVVLPGGGAPVDFGDPAGVDFFDRGPGSSSRCGIVGRQDALSLARSMDSVRATSAWLGLLAAFPSDVWDCESFAAELLRDRAFEAAQEAAHDDEDPTPGPPIEGDLADIDPCSLIPAAAAQALAGDSTGPISAGHGFRWGVPVVTCSLGDYRLLADSRAVISLYSSDADQAAFIGFVDGVLGHGAIQDSIAGAPVWLNECLVAERACTWGIVARRDQYVVVLTITPGNVTSKMARAFAEAVFRELQQLRD